MENGNGVISRVASRCRRRSSLYTFAAARTQHCGGSFSSSSAKDATATAFANFDAVTHLAIELHEVVVHRPQREDHNDPQHRAACAVAQHTELIERHRAVARDGDNSAAHFSERSERDLRVDAVWRLES